MKHPFENDIIPPSLRGYQQDLIAEARAACAKQQAPVRLILQGETGMGKGIVAAALMCNAFSMGKTALFIARGRMLVNQFVKNLRACNLPAGVLMAGHGQNNAPLQVASKDTLASRWLRNEWIGLPRMDLCIVDEAHDSGAEWKALIAKFGIVIGLTATPAQANGDGLGEPWKGIVCCKPPSWLIANGFIVPTKVFAPFVPDLKGVKKNSGTGDYIAESLAKKMDRPSLVGDIVVNWMKYGESRPTLVFAVTIDHAKHIRDRFLAAGIKAMHIDQETPDDQREAIFAATTAGTNTIITNVAVMNRGVDLPCISCIVLARPTRSFILYRQACLDHETEVLTRDGWKGLPEISTLGEVASFDRRTEKIEWCAPENVFARAARGDERYYEVKSPHLDICVTGDHSMVYRSKTFSNNYWKLKEAAELSLKKDHFKVPVSGFQDAPGLPLSNHDLHFIGWFLTDGCRNKINNAITISQSSESPYVENIKQCLDGCGFKYGVYRHKRKGKWAKYADGLEFTISHGLPRGTDKHLTGWARLEPYIGKDFPATLDAMDHHQLAVVLEAMNWGNGCKPKNIPWVQRTYAILTPYKTMADRIQSLCVRRGFRCNVSMQNRHGSPLYTMRICWKQTANIGGANAEAGRSQLREAGRVGDAIVWCMSTKHGTLITRRRGKVAIVGNCGRGKRTFPGKSDLRLIDHAGAIFSHGMPDDDVEWALSEDANIQEKLAKDRGEGRIQEPICCPKCFAMFSPRPACPNCGAVCVPPKKTREVVQGDGLLVPVNGVPAAISLEEKQRFWTKCLFVMGLKGMNFFAARGMFKSKYKEFPDGVKPMAPECDWHHKVEEIYPWTVSRRKASV